MEYLSIRRLPLNEWPEIDRRLWLEAHLPGKPFRKPGLAAGWRTATLESTERGYAVFLGWLAQRGSIDPGVEPIERVSPEIIEAFEGAYAPGRAPGTVAGAIRGIAYVLRAVYPPQGLDWLTKLAHFLSNTAEPSRAKLPRMVHAGELVLLGLKLMEDGKRRHGEGKRSGAWIYRDGLMISTLVRCPPLRRRNLGEMRVGQNFFATETGYRAAFAADETKTGVPLAFDLPSELSAPLSTYLHAVRPALMDGGPDFGWVWIGRRGRPMTLDEISFRVTTITKNHLGRPISPHLFRDIYATDMALYDPEHVRLTKDGLHHSTMDTSQLKYNQATAVAATRRLSAVIASIVDE